MALLAADRRTSLSGLGGPAVVRRIVIGAETPGDSRTMFLVSVNSEVIAVGLTAVQAHILVGEILDEIALPKPAEVAAPGRT